MKSGSVELASNVWKNLGKKENGIRFIRLLHQNLDFYLKSDYRSEATFLNDIFNLTWYIRSKFIKLENRS
ncbi:MAG: hypothetical protein ACFFFG_16380 [Candidatus Thorarchaeota archaeon]